MVTTRVSTNSRSAGPALEAQSIVKLIALLLAGALMLTGVAVYWFLPKVSAQQRPLLRGVATAQLVAGGAAVLMAVFSGLL